MKNPEKKYPGSIFTFGVGVNNYVVEIVKWEDDGTRAMHLTFFYEDIPVGTLPIVNKEGLSKLIDGLTRMMEEDED